jgi:hypothetical protein
MRSHTKRRIIDKDVDDPQGQRPVPTLTVARYHSWHVSSIRRKTKQNKGQMIFTIKTSVFVSFIPHRKRCARCKIWQVFICINHNKHCSFLNFYLCTSKIVVKCEEMQSQSPDLNTIELVLNEFYKILAPRNQLRTCGPYTCWRLVSKIWTQRVHTVEWTLNQLWIYD